MACSGTALPLYLQLTDHANVPWAVDIIIFMQGFPETWKLFKDSSRVKSLRKAGLRHASPMGSSFLQTRWHCMKFVITTWFKFVKLHIYIWYFFTLDTKFNDKYCSYYEKMRNKRITDGRKLISLKNVPYYHQVKICVPFLRKAFVRNHFMFLLADSCKYCK
jgi:hypothetical protein